MRSCRGGGVGSGGEVEGWLGSAGAAPRVVGQRKRGTVAPLGLHARRQAPTGALGSCATPSTLPRVSPSPWCPGAPPRRRGSCARRRWHGSPPDRRRGGGGSSRCRLRARTRRTIVCPPPATLAPCEVPGLQGRAPLLLFATIVPLHRRSHHKLLLHWAVLLDQLHSLLHNGAVLNLGGGAGWAEGQGVGARQPAGGRGEAGRRMRRCQRGGPLQRQSAPTNLQATPPLMYF